MEALIVKETGFFEGIQQVPVKVGPYDTRFPLFYRNVAYLGVYLLAPLDKIRGMLPSSRMHPYRLTPWHGIVTITASEFRDSDVGPYNAVSIGVPFTLERKSPLFTGILRQTPEAPMIYLLHLPVTTEAARATGVEMAGFPEFLADVRFENSGHWLHCQAGTEGKSILSLSGRKPELGHCPRQRVQAITLQRGRLLRSELIYSESQAGTSKKRSDLQLEFGEHPVGQKLKGLNLSRVLQYQYYPAGQSMLSMAIESYAL
jgi:hypothetical protein